MLLFFSFSSLHLALLLSLLKHSTFMVTGAREISDFLVTSDLAIALLPKLALLPSSIIRGPSALTLITSTAKVSMCSPAQAKGAIQEDGRIPTRTN